MSNSTRYLCVSSFKSYPIKKGGGNGPDETLATYASWCSILIETGTSKVPNPTLIPRRNWREISWC